MCPCIFLNVISLLLVVNVQRADNCRLRAPQTREWESVKSTLLSHCRHGSFRSHLDDDLRRWGQWDGRIWHISQLHSAIFIAIKRPVVTGRNWPISACHAAIFIVNSTSAAGLLPDSLGFGRCCRRNCLCHVGSPCLYKTRAFYHPTLKYQHDSRGARFNLPFSYHLCQMTLQALA